MYTGHAWTPQLQQKSITIKIELREPFEYKKLFQDFNKKLKNSGN